MHTIACIHHAFPSVSDPPLTRRVRHLLLLGKAVQASGRHTGTYVKLLRVLLLCLLVCLLLLVLWLLLLLVLWLLLLVLCAAAAAALCYCCCGCSF